MKTARHAALIEFRSVPQRSTTPSYVWSPSTTALTAIVATTTIVNAFESTMRARAFRSLIRRILATRAAARDGSTSHNRRESSTHPRANPRYRDRRDTGVPLGAVGLACAAPRARRSASVDLARVGHGRVDGPGRLSRLARGPLDIANGVANALPRAVEDVFRDRCPQYAASIAYRVLFSLFPLTIVLVSIFGLVLQDDELRQSVIDELIDFLPVSEEGQADVESSIEGHREPAVGDRARLARRAALGRVRDDGRDPDRPRGGAEGRPRPPGGAREGRRLHPRRDHRDARADRGRALDRRLVREPADRGLLRVGRASTRLRSCSCAKASSSS